MMMYDDVMLIMLRVRVGKCVGCVSFMYMFALTARICCFAWWLDVAKAWHKKMCDNLH